MLPKRWDEIKDKLDAVLELDPAQRAAYLDEVSAADPELRQELDSLIASHEKADTDFLNILPLQPALSHTASNDRDPMIGRRLGSYEIVEQIGAGGMGEVYRAYRADDQYRKQVAIKLVGGGVNSGLIVSRFRNERQILADLDHPNIARLLEGGSTEDGHPYFLMEYIQGQPLDRYCDENKLSVSERLKLFRSICSAVQYAHQKLVVHRDIKPSNILVTKEGIPKLLDFGIAKILGPDSGALAIDRTVTKFRMLTPEYASPEQWRGEAITTASDVYSLGVVLYELLTGHRPYRIADRPFDEMDRLAGEQEPERPSSAVLRVEAMVSGGQSTQRNPESVSATREGTPVKLRRRLRGDLDNIILTALRREPQRRYATVEQCSEDLRRHL